MAHLDCMAHISHQIVHVWGKLRFQLEWSRNGLLVKIVPTTEAKLKNVCKYFCRLPVKRCSGILNLVSFRVGLLSLWPVGQMRPM